MLLLWLMTKLENQFRQSGRKADMHWKLQISIISHKVVGMTSREVTESYLTTTIMFELQQEFI